MVSPGLYVPTNFSKPGRFMIIRVDPRSCANFFSRPDHLVSVLAVLAQMLRRIQARVPVMLQEAEEIIAPDEIELARLQCLTRQFVRFPGNCRMQA